MEAKLLGISVSDVKKRKLWLGSVGENVKYTHDPSQPTNELQRTKRASRNLRAHEGLYCLRVFVANESKDFDQAWQTPQKIWTRKDARYHVQGYLQPVQACREACHAEVARELKATGGPLPPSRANKRKAEDMPTGAASKTKPSIEQDSIRLLRTTTKGAQPKPPAPLNPKKRPRPSSASSTSEQTQSTNSGASMQHRTKILRSLGRP